MAKAAARKIARGEARIPRSVSGEYRIGDYPMHYIASIQRQNQINLGRQLRDQGLSVPMWRALSALHGKDAQTIGQIADLAVLDRSSLGRLLEEMAADGLVEREGSVDDRRAVLIRLSAAGRKRFEAVLPVIREHYRHLLRGFDDDEFETLMRLLRRLKANARMMSAVTNLEDD
jgi:MarR family transcriptional regulator, organic hydroperoxide resistance regulator